MGYIEGLLGGFMDRKYAVEKQNAQQGEQASQRERAVFEHLLQADDPEVRNLALTGLLDSANPRRKAGGLKGWIGETTASPYLKQVQDLTQTPTMQPVQEPHQTLPARQSQSGLATPGIQPTLTETPEAGASAAMPENSPVKPGAPPPTPVSYTQAPPTPYSITRLALRPRQVFLSPTEQYGSNAAAKEVGDITGLKAGLRAAMPDASEDDINGIVRQHVAKKYGATLRYAHVPVEIPDGQGGFTQTMASYDKATGQYQDDSGTPMYGARPLQHTASTSMGADREWVAHRLFNKRPIELTPQESAQLDQVLTARKNGLTTKDALNMARGFLPNATLDQQLQLADQLKSGTQAPEPATPGGAVTPPPGAAPAATPAVGGPPAPPTATPPGQKPLTSLAPAGMGDLTKESGKPPSPAIQKSIASTQSMNDLIDKAIAALEPYKNDTSLDGTMKLVAKYKAGTESNPIALAAAQIPNLVSLQQAASQSLGGTSRSQRIYADKLQHTPRLPSGRQIMFAHGGKRIPGIGADMVSDISQMRKGDEGGFDSPAQMYQKLVGLRDVNTIFLNNTKSGAGLKPAASHDSTAPPPPAGRAYKDADGKWVLP